jgi:hypothetical protein
MRRYRQLHRGRYTHAGTMWPSKGLLRWGVLVATLVLALCFELSGVAQPVEVALTPLVPGATPPAATPLRGDQPHQPL